VTVQGSTRRPQSPGPSGLRLPEELVTGEAVVLDLRPASFATRTLALLLDLFLTFLIGFITLFLLSATAGLDQAAGTAVVLITVVALLLGLPVTIETLSRGRSVGKLAAGLRVVRDDGGPIRFRHALIRGLLGVIEIYLLTGWPALLTSLTSARGQRLGDLLAGTYVIRERSAGEQPAPPPMPYELAGWAAGTDLGRIPDPLALAVRQFLQRADRLHPQARHQLGIELATALAGYVAPAAPAGTHPERFLAGVLAERRRRDLIRLQHELSVRADQERRRAEASPLSPAGTALVGGLDNAAKGDPGWPRPQ
jgi:uncharacterized RDD family membrane protein YckC